MRLIADYAGLVVSGGNGRMKFICPDGTYVRFENGADTATVNGTRVSLGGTATITVAKKDVEGKCLVPFSFVQDLFSYAAPNEGSPGLKILYYSNNNSIVIGKMKYEDGNAVPVSFSADCFDIAENAFMKNNQEKHPDIAFAYTKNTLLVNKSNPLGEDFAPEGLLSLNEIGCPVVEDREFLLNADAAKALKLMVDDMYVALDGSETILVTSAYRSYERQVILFERYINSYMQNEGMSRDEAEKAVTATSARPGQSEHQSALCIDFIEKGKLELDERFENTNAFSWLSKNAHKYGFIIRYPRDKESLTGYDYEPWHYRFVGIDAATIIYEDNICLEEYLAKY